MIRPISTGNGFYYWNGGYESRHIPKQAGMRWNPKAKVWETKDVSVVAKLREYIEPGGDVDAAVRTHLAEVEAAIEASRATDADIEIPAPDGLDYRPFQRAGIAYAMSRPATLIADEMGLGKTIQALGVINASPEILRVLVICPASLRLNWLQESQRWLTRDFHFKVVDTKALIKPEDNFVIINYDILRKHLDALHATEWDLLICDESHYLKSAKAQRTCYVLGGKRGQVTFEPIRAKRKLFLSGTPIVNRPVEAQTILGAIRPDLFGNYYKYAKRYCNAYHSRWGFDATGASNLDELQDLLRGNCMIRRMKADVLTELPAKQRSVIELPINGNSSVVKAEQRATAHYELQMIEMKAAVELAKASDDPADYEEAVRNLRQLAQIYFEEISVLRRKTAIAKAPIVAAYVSEVIEETMQKVVLFAHHREVVEILINELRQFGVVKIQGGDSLEDRNQAVNDFQNDPDIKVFIGSIQAAGVGLTLTASSHVVFAELDWVPGNMTQAEDRCHRIGQEDQVLVQHLVLQDSLDANMANAIVAKQQVIDSALDTETDRDHEEPILAIAQQTETPPLNTHRKQLEKVADALTPAEIEAIHANLKTLAAYCDGALVQDGMGFNKIDTAIGKSLAASGSLTAKQAALGKRLTQKYRRQLTGDSS